MRRMLVLVLLAACTQGSGNEFTISGAVSGATGPQSNRVAVFWRLAASAAQYKYGDGTASQYEFVLTLDADPPAGAINPSGIAVGEVVMVSSDTTIADGPVTTPPTLLGVSMDHAVIWKDALGTGMGSWDTTFGARYSCAHCVRSAAGGKDSYELVGCAQVTVKQGGASTCLWY